MGPPHNCTPAHLNSWLGSRPGCRHGRAAAEHLMSTLHITPQRCVACNIHVMLSVNPKNVPNITQLSLTSSRISHHTVWNNHTVTVTYKHLNILSPIHLNVFLLYHGNYPENHMITRWTQRFQTRHKLQTLHLCSKVVIYLGTIMSMNSIFGDNVRFKIHIYASIHICIFLIHNSMETMSIYALLNAVMN